MCFCSCIVVNQFRCTAVPCLQEIVYLLVVILRRRSERGCYYCWTWQKRNVAINIQTGTR